ncbi:hypothetical protein [Lentzea waywayandensis]|uniref:hypothetical protein n=1 Tax=Lentzea waywayandensis TaxID=84724 RepID=UPI00116050A8|nr:hypothetical protein [Lentzea waywayandensis]
MAAHVHPVSEALARLDLQPLPDHPDHLAHLVVVEVVEREPVGAVVTVRGEAGGEFRARNEALEHLDHPVDHPGGGVPAEGPGGILAGPVQEDGGGHPPKRSDC